MSERENRCLFSVHFTLYNQEGRERGRLPVKQNEVKEMLAPQWRFEKRVGTVRARGEERER